MADAYSAIAATPQWPGFMPVQRKSTATVELCEDVDRNALRRCRKRDASSAGKDLARAHATTPDRGV